jgi:hypothetical protein
MAVLSALIFASRFRRVALYPALRGTYRYGHWCRLLCLTDGPVTAFSLRVRAQRSVRCHRQRFAMFCSLSLISARKPGS